MGLLRWLFGSSKPRDVSVPTSVNTFDEGVAALRGKSLCSEDNFSEIISIIRQMWHINHDNGNYERDWSMVVDAVGRVKRLTVFRKGQGRGDAIFIDQGAGEDAMMIEVSDRTVNHYADEDSCFVYFWEFLREMQKKLDCHLYRGH